MTTLLDRAKDKLDTVMYKSKHTTYDDAMCDNMCFDIQQCIEFTLKWKLEQIGIQYPKTHDLRSLCDLLEESGVSVYSVANLSDRADSITKWETTSRYGNGVLSNKYSVDIAIKICEDLLIFVSKSSIPDEFKNAISSL